MAGTCELELDPFTVRVTVSFLSICVMYLPHCLSLWCIPYTLAHTDTLTPLNTRMAGTYNPIPNKYAEKIITLNYERIKYWLVIGAQPSVCLCLCLFFLCGSVFCVLIFKLAMFFFCMAIHRIAWWIHNTTRCKYAFNDMWFAGTFVFLCRVCV